MTSEPQSTPPPPRGRSCLGLGPPLPSPSLGHTCELGQNFVLPIGEDECLEEKTGPELAAPSTPLEPQPRHPGVPSAVDLHPPPPPTPDATQLPEVSTAHRVCAPASRVSGSWAVGGGALTPQPQDSWAQGHHRQLGGTSQVGCPTHQPGKRAAAHSPANLCTWRGTHPY